MKTTIFLAFPAADCYQWFNRATKTYNAIADGLGDYLIGSPAKGSKPWVAEIIGKDDKFKYKRTFLSPKWDYSRSDSRGSSGVRLWFTLDCDAIYEVNQRISSKQSERFFCMVNNHGELIEIEKGDVDRWLKDHSE